MNTVVLALVVTGLFIGVCEVALRVAFDAAGKGKLP